MRSLLLKLAASKHALDSEQPHEASLSIAPAARNDHSERRSGPLHQRTLIPPRSAATLHLWTGAPKQFYSPRAIDGHRPRAILGISASTLAALRLNWVATALSSQDTPPSQNLSAVIQADDVTVLAEECRKAVTRSNEPTQSPLLRPQRCEGHGCRSRTSVIGRVSRVLGGGRSFWG